MLKNGLKTLFLGLAFTAAGAGLFEGFRLWKIWVQDAPEIRREIIAAGPLPERSMPFDLEAFVPADAVVVLGLRNSGNLADAFAASNLSKLFQEWSAGAAAPSKLFRQILSKSVLAAFYPAQAAIEPVSFDPSDLRPKIPSFLLLARADPSVTPSSLLGPMFKAFLPAAGQGPILQLGPGIFLAIAKSAPDSLLVLGSDIEKIKFCLSLIESKGAQVPSAALSNSNWVRQAMARIPHNSFSYTLTKDDSLKSLNLGMMDLPLFTDWSVTSLAWSHGLRTTGFSHITPTAGASLKEWSVAGPAGYDTFPLAPRDSLLILATNSLLPEYTASFLKNHAAKTRGMPPAMSEILSRRAGLLANQLDPQALLAYSGLQKSAEGFSQDAVGMVQFRSWLRGFAVLKLFEWSARKEGAAYSVEAEKIQGLGKIYSAEFKPPEGRVIKIYFALNGRMFYLGTRKESFILFLADRKSRAPGSAQIFPAGLPPKSNFTLLVDSYGLYRNLAAAGFEQNALKNPGAANLPWKSWVMSFLDAFSGFKRGGIVFTNCSEGIASDGLYPYEDMDIPAWEAKLAFLKPAALALLASRPAVQPHQAKAKPVRARKLKKKR